MLASRIEGDASYIHSENEYHICIFKKIMRNLKLIHIYTLDCTSLLLLDTPFEYTYDQILLNFYSIIS